MHNKLSFLPEGQKNPRQRPQELEVGPHIAHVSSSKIYWERHFGLNLDFKHSFQELEEGRISENKSPFTVQCRNARVESISCSGLGHTSCSTLSSADRGEAAREEAHIRRLTSGCSHQDAHIRMLTSGCSQKEAHIRRLTSGCSQKDAHIRMLKSGCSHQDASKKRLTSGCPKRLLTSGCSPIKDQILEILQS